MVSVTSLQSWQWPNRKFDTFASWVLLFLNSLTASVNCPVLSARSWLLFVKSVSVTSLVKACGTGLATYFCRSVSNMLKTSLRILRKSLLRCSRKSTAGGCLERVGNCCLGITARLDIGDNGFQDVPNDLLQNEGVGFYNTDKTIAHWKDSRPIAVLWYGMVKDLGNSIMLWSDKTGSAVHECHHLTCLTSPNCQDDQHLVIVFI
jgi:hypothetical protein